MTEHLTPVAIQLHTRSRELELEYAGGEHYSLSCEYLRVHSPSAEVQGHGPGQEILQAGRRALPVYRLKEANGPDHDRVYRVEVLIGDRVYGTGQGRTKKSAEQNAAQATLLSLDKDL